VQLRRVDVAGLARLRNYLPALDLVTTLHHQFLGMTPATRSLNTR
jgi:hypothetical protein